MSLVAHSSYVKHLEKQRWVKDEQEDGRKYPTTQLEIYCMRNTNRKCHICASAEALSWQVLSQWLRQMKFSGVHHQDFPSTISLTLRHGYPFKVQSKAPDQSRHPLH